MAMNARPSDIMADTRGIEGTEKWYWIMDDQYDKKLWVTGSLRHTLH